MPAARTPAAHPEEQSPLPFLAFTPAPVRARRDGWTPDHQRRFILHLARGHCVDEAARLVGRSRQTAYALRGRAGASGFAAAWDAAIAFAGAARGAGAACANLPGAMTGPAPTLLVPRFYRGRLIGYVLREDLSGLMSTLRRLDRLSDREAGGIACRPGKRDHDQSDGKAGGRPGQSARKQAATRS